MITQLLLEYIKQKIAAGLSHQEIKYALRQQGWSEEEIKEAFFWLWYYFSANNAYGI